MAKFIFYIRFFPIYKNVGWILSRKTKKGFQKRSWKVSRSFWRRKTTNNVNILVNDIEIFLKRKKTKRKNMVMNIVTISLKMRNKEYRKNHCKMWINNDRPTFFGYARLFLDNNIELVFREFRLRWR